MNDHAPIKELFGFDSGLKVPFARTPDDLREHVPDVDPTYVFDPDVTTAILAGFAHNRRVLIQGLHGTGKSTHVEQVAARLGWPCVRVNLDGHLSRLDFVGRDMVVVRDGVQVTEFSEGILPWALRRPVVLLLDEYDAGRPDVMFVLQRVLEHDGALTLLDQNTVLRPHQDFRLFGTANTVGLGDTSGLYHGVQRLNHAQLDRWSVVTTLNYLPADREIDIVLGRVSELADQQDLVAKMVEFAGLTRAAFAAGDLSTLMSPRTVIGWGENIAIFGDTARALRLAFANKCADDEKQLVAEFYQRCFDADLQLTRSAVG